MRYSQAYFSALVSSFFRMLDQCRLFRQYVMYLHRYFPAWKRDKSYWKDYQSMFNAGGEL